MQISCQAIWYGLCYCKNRAKLSGAIGTIGAIANTMPSLWHTNCYCKNHAKTVGTRIAGGRVGTRVAYARIMPGGGGGGSTILCNCPYRAESA